MSYFNTFILTFLLMIPLTLKESENVVVRQYFAVFEDGGDLKPKPFDTAFGIAMLVETMPKNPHAWVEIKGDSGGVTKYGISERYLPEEYNTKGTPAESVKKLTVMQAREIYRSKYWDEPKIKDLPDDIAIVVFNYAINVGNTRAIKLLQKVLGVEQDGVIGVETIGASKTLDNVIALYHEAQKKERKRLAQYPEFGDGWDNRDNTVVEYIMVSRKEGLLG